MPYIIIGGNRIDREMRVVVKMHSKELGAGLDSLIITPHAALRWIEEIVNSVGGAVIIFDDKFSTNESATGCLTENGVPKKKIIILKKWLGQAQSS